MGYTEAQPFTGKGIVLVHKSKMMTKNPNGALVLPFPQSSMFLFQSLSKVATNCTLFFALLTFPVSGVSITEF